MSSAGVSFRKLRVRGLAQDTRQASVSNFPVRAWKKVQYALATSGVDDVEILHGCDGEIKAGEMLLVLGRPGSGCTTLLKTLAGELHGLKVDAASVISYQGSSKPNCSYLAETDVHFPTLTVKETLHIAARARVFGGGKSTRDDDVHDRVERTVHSIGLSEALNTKVGNDSIPGISGGEKKRLSIAEVLITRKPIQCWDNPTRGLDSSNALAFVKALKADTTSYRTVAIVSLYQASQEICQHFDKVLVLDKGKQLYFGSLQSGQRYFEALGFVCPRRTSPADYLLSVTNAQRRQLTGDKPAVKHLTTYALNDLWLASQEYSVLSKSVSTTMSAGITNQADSRLNASQNNGDYSVSIFQQVRICLWRAMLRLKNDLAPPISSIVANGLIGIILGSVYYNLQDTTASFYSRSALLFFTTLLNAFVTGFEPSMLWEQRPIVEKHYRYALFEPFADAIASMISDLPNKICLTIFFNIPVYFLANLRRTAGAFFTYLLFTFTCLLTMSMIFRTIGSSSTTLAGSMAPAAVFMLILMIYTGFTLPIFYMHPWLRWLNYLDPVAYCFESLMINEYHGRTFSCSDIVPDGPSYQSVSGSSKVCNAPGAQLGKLSVSGDTYLAITYGYEISHLWRNLGILIAIMVFTCLTHLFTTQYLTIKKSKGELLRFRHKHNLGFLPSNDEEKQSLQSSSSETVGSQVRQEKQGPVQLSDPSLVWNKLDYSIDLKKERKQILNNLEGYVQPGSLTALMGVSGAGKTTLLNVLADRTVSGIFSGDISCPITTSTRSFARNIGYAKQSDIHLDTSTVREALQFSALLRQPGEYTYEQKLEYVEEIIHMLDMSAFSDAIVGVPGEGLNVEQRKRLTIAVELVARPEILFLDEPTSGLDADSAWSICSLLRHLTDEGYPIICTIHQPSVAILRMFDRLLLLKNEGECVYFGDLGHDCQTAMQYFEVRGANPCKEDENPGDWFIETVSGSTAASTIDWAANWRDSSERKQVKEYIESIQDKVQSLPRGHRAEFATTFWKQVKVVTVRLYSHYWRTPSYIYSKTVLCIFTALIIGFSFWMSPSTLQGTQNQIFSVFLVMTAFTNLDQQIVSQHLGYRSLFETRESSSRMYRWTVFLVSNILVELPWQTLMSVVLFGTWYYPIGFSNNASNMADASQRAGLVLLSLWSFMMFTLTASLAVIAVFESGPVAINIAQLFWSLSLIFCGVLVSPASLPSFWQFMYRVSPVTYFVNALVGPATGAAPLYCSASELLLITPPNGTTCAQYLADYLSKSMASLLNPGAPDTCEVCPYSNTETILNTLGIEYENRWKSFGITLVYSCVNILLMFGLYWLCRVPKRPKLARKDEE